MSVRARFIRLLTAAILFLGILETGWSVDRRLMYGKIVDINPFRLEPEPPPSVEAPTAEPEPVIVNVNVTGFSKRNNVKKVYLMVPPSKDNSEPQYLTLQEKDRHGSIEVLEINPEKESVKIRNAGKVALLTFESHGMKATAAAKAPVNNSKSSPRPTTTAGRSNNRATSNTANVSGPYVIGRGGVRQDASQYLPQNSAGAVPVSASNLNGSRVISPRNTLGSRRNNVVNPAPNNPFQGTGDEIAIQQRIAIEAQRIANPNMNIPPVPGMPSTLPQPPAMDGQP